MVNCVSDFNHKLHKHLPKQQLNMGQCSSRLPDIPIVYNNITSEYMIFRDVLFALIPLLDLTKNQALWFEIHITNLSSKKLKSNWNFKKNWA